MKLITMLAFCTLSFSVLADIAPPPPNYTKLTTVDDAIDVIGEIDDDPEQEVVLTAAESVVVKTDITQSKNDLKKIWQLRMKAAAWHKAK